MSTIDLKGLDDTGVMSFMEAAAGHALDDAGVSLAHQLYRETDGNPFFVARSCSATSPSRVRSSRTPPPGAGPQRDDDGVTRPSPSVRTVIGTRVSRLGEEATKVLSTAAVIGRDFDLDLLVGDHGMPTTTMSSTSSTRPIMSPSSPRSQVSPAATASPTR